MGCFIVAEAGVNHNGDEALALRLIEAAAQAGADAVKFQSFHAERLTTAAAAKADYQREQTGLGGQLPMLRALELPDAAFGRLRERCEALRIEFMSTPFDAEAADMLVGLGMRRIKVPSGEVTNLPLLRHLASLQRPLILSTGMSTLEEVADAVQTIRGEWERHHFAAADALTLLHCTSNYPTEAQDVNLRAMLTLREVFGVPVGYSDHTPGSAVAVAAVALGAAVIEKHFTLDRGLPGPDHQASLEPGALAAMIRDIRTAEAALGSRVKQPAASELPVRDVVRRSVTLTRSVRAGEALRGEDLALLRPGTGIPPRDLDAVKGRRAARDLSAGTTLHWSDLAP
jgi:N-acetylneuraminate synthase